MVQAKDSFTVENILAIILLFLLVPIYFIIEKFSKENYKDLEDELNNNIEQDEEQKNNDKKRTQSMIIKKRQN